MTATTLPTPATSESKQELGQFFTPRPVAEFMASLFESLKDENRLLDAGAGDIPKRDSPKSGEAHE